MSNAVGGKIDGKALRRGWTTGACATAATKAALGALLGDGFADPVRITLPGGQEPAFALAREEHGDGFALAAIIKDAGDDPDVTHGATIISKVEYGTPGSGLTFVAGPGVGTVTKPGLPLPPGQPAINPVPREMMTRVVSELCAAHNVPGDICITISVPNGEKIAEQTWNPRLGILGGISILGTTGIVIPYSCAAWIHSIHRGVDVARALGIEHVAGATGDASERAAQARLGLPIESYIDMGDFAGGFLKYVRQHPVPRVTIAGGFAKLCKLAQGALDLHSARSTVDLNCLAEDLLALGGTQELAAKARAANTAKEVLELANAAKLPLAQHIAEAAQVAAKAVVKSDEISIGILVVDRAGKIIVEAE